MTGSVAQKVALTVAGLICFLIFLEILALVQIYFVHHRETAQEAALVSSMISEQIDNYNVSVLPSKQLPIFDLQQWRNLERLNITFISNNGTVIESNHQYRDDKHSVMTALIKAVLDHFHQKSVMIEEPVMINSTEVGKIIIRNDVFHELKYIGVGIIELLLPILITFILSSFLVIFLFSLVLERIDGQLNFPKPEENKTGRLRHLSVFNIKRLFMRIVESSENLKRLFHKQKHKAIELQEIERKRLAAELHDELGQLLTTMRIELDTFYQSDDLNTKETTIASLKQRSERMSAILRSNLKQLRPPNLSEFGLGYCLDELVNDWAYHHPQHHLILNIQCNLRLLEPHFQLICYRIIQEGLTNISRHAGDNVKASVTLYKHKQTIIIEIIDNGRGCDLSEKQHGYGILGMRERTDTLSGKVNIESQPGHGMKIQITLPWVSGDIDGKN